VLAQADLQAAARTFDRLVQASHWSRRVWLLDCSLCRHWI